MRLACVQSHVAFGEPYANVESALGHIEQAKSNGCDLVGFPEAFLTGYCVDSREAASKIAIHSDHPALLAIEEAANGLDIMVVLGFAESQGSTLYNTAALIEPGKATRYYRKTHLPILGLDNFVQAGDGLPVFDTRVGKVGIIICFDLRPPEAARALALKGADLIVLPTNWPRGAEITTLHFAVTRAVENRVFLATCNRVGTENGFTFIGQSKIISPLGKILAAADAEEEVIAAELDLAEARNKRNVVIPGKYETTVLESRRPELYDSIVEPSALLAK